MSHITHNFVSYYRSSTLSRITHVSNKIFTHACFSIELVGFCRVKNANLFCQYFYNRENGKMRFLLCIIYFIFLSLFCAFLFVCQNKRTNLYLPSQGRQLGQFPPPPPPQNTIKGYKEGPQKKILSRDPKTLGRACIPTYTYLYTFCL